MYGCTIPESRLAGNRHVATEALRLPSPGGMGSNGAGVGTFAHQKGLVCCGIEPPVTKFIAGWGTSSESGGAALSPRRRLPGNGCSSRQDQPSFFERI